ncbi:dnaJ homolog subfamily C member 4-like [Porites lutea]|uniref:dnaJ homolog subfamily C member 4-like n=1 Tax=Porites lutea TaxID=51062 RepID=UPI003CC6235D
MLMHMCGARPEYHPFIVFHSACPYSTATQASSSRKPTLYEILDVSETATLGEIKNAFIKKSKESHPDTNPLKPELHNTFVEVSEAYNILSDASSRRAYDLSLLSSFNSSSSSRGSPFGSVPRNRQSSYSYYYEKATSSSNYRQSRTYDFTAPHVHVNRAQKQKHNRLIMLGAFVFMMTGATVSYLIIRTRHNLYRAHMDESNRRAHQVYSQAVERGRANGLKRQLEHLIAQSSSGLEKIAASKSIQHLEEKRE